MVRTWLRRLSGTDVIMFTVGVFLAVMIVIGSAATLASGKYSLAAWQNLILFGLAQGSIYALIALGYTLVYGILRMINFAHSEVFMSGPFTAYFVAAGLADSGLLEQQPVLGLLIIGVVAMLVSMGIALAVERIAYRP